MIRTELAWKGNCFEEGMWMCVWSIAGRESGGVAEGIAVGGLPEQGSGWICGLGYEWVLWSWKGGVVVRGGARWRGGDGFWYAGVRFVDD
jgi:hypothetical protein